MKKLLAALLCVMMVVVFMPTMAFAEGTPADTAEPTDPGVTCTEASCSHEAAITKDGVTKHYASVSEAVQNANGATITLLKDIEHSETITITDLVVTIDLNTHNIGFVSGSYFLVQGGSLTLTGEGMVFEEGPYYGPIMMKGSPDEAASNYSVVNVGKDVTLKGWAALFINQTKTPEKAPSNYGMVANVSGKLITVKDTSGDVGSGIYVNGQITNEGSVPKITLDGATISAPEGGLGMYLAGYADTTITNSKITSNQDGGTGIEIRAGKLVISDSTVTGGSGTYECDPNGDGSTSNNVALVVAQHTTTLPIDVTVNSGEFTGGTAFAQASPQENPNPEIVKVQILDGTYTGEITSEDKTGFVKGGTFSTDFTTDEEKAYLPADTKTVQNAEGKYVLADKELESADKAVASIGDTLYSNLKAATDAVEDGQTITILKDIDNATGIAVASGKDFTLDFDNHTYTLTGPGAGSTNTETNGFQLLKDSTITFKDGTIKIAENATLIKRIIQNYADLTLENMQIYAANQVDGEAYALSFNNGDITFKGNTSVITTSPDTVAFDVYYWEGSYPDGTKVTFDESYTGTVNGKIVYDSVDETKAELAINGKGNFGAIETSDATVNGENISISGGTFDKDVPEDFLATGKDTYERVNGKFTVAQKTESGQKPDLAPTPGYQWVEVKDENGNVSFVEQKVSSGYYPTTPTVQNPTIETSEGVTVTKDSTGTTATITVADGYELVDVTVNGVSKGKVTTLTGLKTGDKVVVTAQKVSADDTDDQIAELKSVKLVARSAMSKAKGKKAVKITWYATDGSDVELDGVEIFRSTERYSGYGTKPFFSTTKDQYHNTAIKVGTKYYYKVRGYKVIDGKKYYTEYSTKAWRTVK